MSEQTWNQEQIEAAINEATYDPENEGAGYQRDAMQEIAAQVIRDHEIPEVVDENK